MHFMRPQLPDETLMAVSKVVSLEHVEMTKPCPVPFNEYHTPGEFGLKAHEVSLLVKAFVRDTGLEAFIVDPMIV
jgi:hypothetical protein